MAVVGYAVGNILDDVAREVDAQFEQWGEQTHPSLDAYAATWLGTAERVAEEYEIPTATRAKFLCENAREFKRMTWAHILIEEVAEAIEAGTLEGEGEHLREELVQSAAVIVSWIKCIDDRNSGD